MEERLNRCINFINFDKILEKRIWAGIMRWIVLCEVCTAAFFYCRPIR